MTNHYDAVVLSFLDRPESLLLKDMIDGGEIYRDTGARPGHVCACLEFLGTNLTLWAITLDDIRTADWYCLNGVTYTETTHTKDIVEHPSSKRVTEATRSILNSVVWDYVDVYVPVGGTSRVK